MVKIQKYDWTQPPPVDEHSKRKLKVLGEYFFEYLQVRCSHPFQRRFRLAVVDGFAGGGLYRCGTAGSPIVFIQSLYKAANSINALREASGFPNVEIECLFIFNDSDADAITALKSNVLIATQCIPPDDPNFRFEVTYLGLEVDTVFPVVEHTITMKNFTNVLVNLDQYGHSGVETSRIAEIMGWADSVEVFLTFSISALLAFLNKRDPNHLRNQLRHLGIRPEELAELRAHPRHTEWLGAAEKIVYNALQRAAPFVSPFAINNPDGWEYWLMHFAKSPRARQVYNDVLHRNAGEQAHFGRSGLHMLSYDPGKEAALYLFNEPARKHAFEQLYDDIPRLVALSGDTMTVSDFYAAAYSATPAHAEDIRRALIENPDLRIITPSGGERRKANMVRTDDVIHLTRQLGLFHGWRPAK